MKRNKRLEDLSVKLGKYSFLRTVLRPFYKFIYSDRFINERRKSFLKNGVELLQRLDEAFQKEDITYTLAFGSLLGAVREHGLIKHDLDLDIAVPSETNKDTVFNALNRVGFRLTKRIEVDNGDFGREETYTYNETTVDIFYFYRDENGEQYTIILYPFKGLTYLDSKKQRGGLLPMQVWLPIDFKKIEYVPFETIKMPIPTNAIDFILTRYGENWRIPDPTFVYPKPGYNKFKYREDKIGIVEIDE